MTGLHDVRHVTFTINDVSNDPVFYIIMITTGSYLVRLLLCKKWSYILFQVVPQVVPWCEEIQQIHAEWLYESCDSGDIFVISIQIRRSTYHDISIDMNSMSNDNLTDVECRL